MADNMAEEEFKKYQALMAKKRVRKSDKNKSSKGKERLLPEKLTIQRLSSQVKGSSQKYSRMGPLKRVDVLENDLCVSPTIDVVRRACVAGFNMKGYECDLLETERGPSIESLNEIKNLNGTIFVRFTHKLNSLYSVSEFLDDSDEEEDININSNSEKSKVKDVPAPKRGKLSNAPIQSAECAITTKSDSEERKSFPPSLSVATMLKMGKLVKPRERETIQVEIEGFDIKNGWAATRSTTFCVDSQSFGEGGFRKAYKCESSDGSLPGMWVLKKYKQRALDDMKIIGMEEEEHARKQVQMHMLAQNIAGQMEKNAAEDFGPTFAYDSMYFGRIKEDGNTKCFVTIEQYMEGKFIKYINNDGSIVSGNEEIISKKAEALVHYSYQVSQGEFLLVDIQGTGYNLYDPEVASKSLMSDVGGEEKLNFCMGNMASDVMKTFFLKHSCNIYCTMLGLKKDDPNYYISLKVI